MGWWTENWWNLNNILICACLWFFGCAKIVKLKTHEIQVPKFGEINLHEIVYKLQIQLQNNIICSFLGTKNLLFLWS